ncbi:MAG TPA: hypothetical protein VK422_11495 [Pyrinomonadaceae bacterium]|nr:hypothetical protein [Pyrinomonadaceae bacterium]
MLLPNQWRIEVNAHRVETIIDQDGTLTLNGLPFQAGAEVEVIILERPATQSGDNPYPLRDQPVEYDAPAEPVAENEWDALQ